MTFRLIRKPAESTVRRATSFEIAAAGTFLEIAFHRFELALQPSRLLHVLTSLVMKQFNF